MAQAARGSGSADSGRAKTALGEIESTGFELEGATCRTIWFDVFSAKSIGLDCTAVNASSLLLIFSSSACSRSVVTVRLACIIAASRACAGSPIVLWREDWHRLTGAKMYVLYEHTITSIYARKKKAKRAQLGNRVEFLLASTFDFLPDPDHLSPRSFDPRKDRVGTFREFFETRVRIMQEDPGGCADLVLERELGMRRGLRCGRIG